MSKENLRRASSLSLLKHTNQNDLEFDRGAIGNASFGAERRVLDLSIPEARNVHSVFLDPSVSSESSRLEESEGSIFDYANDLLERTRLVRIKIPSATVY